MVWEQIDRLNIMDDYPYGSNCYPGETKDVPKVGNLLLDDLTKTIKVNSVDFGGTYYDPPVAIILDYPESHHV